MALFGLGKKKAEEAPKATTPVDEVLRMKQQGFTNNQIVQALQRNGYKMHQIFDAMNQADLKSAGPIEGAVPPGMAQQPEQQEQEPLPEIPTQLQTEPQAQVDYGNQMEEIAETIIEEKWEDLMKEINKLLEWKEGLENRMAAVEQGMKDLKGDFDNVQKSVMGKVSEYDKTMKTVGTDVKAMDSVFQKILPQLTENVNELSRLTKKAKSKKQ